MEIKATDLMRSMGVRVIEVDKEWDECTECEECHDPSISCEEIAVSKAEAIRDSRREE